MSGGPQGATCANSWRPKRGFRFVESYAYVDENGELIEERARFESDGSVDGARSKEFVRRWPTDGPGFAYRRPQGAREVIFHLPAVVEAAEVGGAVWWVEGEKDANNLAGRGLTATTLGASSARIPADLATQLKGIERLFIVPDNDDPGRKHAEIVAAAAHDHVGEVRLVELPDLPEHGDVTDFLEKAGTDELYRAAEEATRWLPVRQQPAESEGNASGGSSRGGNELLALVEMLIGDGVVELFHDREGTAFATLRPPTFDSILTFRLDDRKCSSYFEGALVQQRAARGESLKALTQASRADALRTLETIAVHQGQEAEVYLRVAHLAGSVVLDLGGLSGAAVVIDGTGWKVVEEPPVRFRRSKRMLALPIPQSGGNLDLLRNYVRVSDEDFPLALTWLMSALSGKGPNPLAVMYGEQGSGKSTTAKCLRGLVDPATPMLRALPQDERTLVIGAHSNHVLGFDNLSVVPPALSDALCRIATGEGFAVRTMYSDRDEEVFGGARPIILTGIEEAASRPDLLDRSFLIETERRPPNERRQERELLASFEADRPQILGCLLDGLVDGIREGETVHLDSSHRMVDAVRFAHAAEVGLGLPVGTIKAAVERAGESATSVAIEASPVAKAIQDWYLSNGPWSGTATELLRRLDGHRGDGRAPGGWPTTAKGLSSALGRVVPSLRDVGIPVDHRGPQGHNRSRLWVIGDPAALPVDQELGL
jgi:energy-coupling factor transporter ATP-binding protein EcfA2